ncbi:glycosyltransferase family 1 protein [Cryobacterium sp. TMS1-20-1]|uniref:glycosyltransferase family 4 protein n=1 Tax=unclassified Cryobacterium TaxID=2649013 RepID=UPI0010692BA7|nr:MULTISPECIES: glycosyltransferase family 1 protein [unclassified Cryobacterium]TFC72407.1 glycosyltransferase family 1 protein [Cryobacterium sp. TMS1-20-1]TFD55481.1 glycosyltransferase family 1 protein [Cryobacterium sp. Hh7]
MTAPSVLIDATCVPRSRGGVGRYVDSVIPALVGLGAQITVVCQEHDTDLFRASGASVVAAPARVNRVLHRLIWEQTFLPALARRLQIDVIHSPHYTFPVLTRLPRVVTLHDMTFFSLPDLHSPVKKIFFKAWIHLSRILRLTVVTPSQATADEYVRVTGATPSDVVVALLGYDAEQFHRPSEQSIESFRTAHQLPSGWVAFLGTLEPRKNIPTLIAGYRNAMGDRTQASRPALLLAGGDGWDHEIEPAITRAVLDGFDVRKLGYLPLTELSAFLGGAAVVAYPSLGEGFGLPVLEAMATGACVLTTRRLAIPEIGGDAVEYTEVSVEAISQSLRALVADPNRCRELREAGIQRSHSFTWASTAGKHQDAYRRALRS